MTDVIIGRRKWSLGRFFRRRKKTPEIDSGSSSPEDNCKKFVMSRKKKKKPQKKDNVIFDHIVFHPMNNGNFEKRAVNGGGSVETSKSSHESSLTVSSYGGSLDSSTKKWHRERARRRRDDRLFNNNGSSSDEGSQQGSTAGTLSSQEGTINDRISRKTRSARTERYMRRLSHTDEQIINKEAELIRKAQAQAPPRVVYLPATNYSSQQQILPLHRTTPDSYYMPKSYLTPKPPPVPPPRDPQRRVLFPPNPPINENSQRPISYAFEQRNSPKPIPQKRYITRNSSDVTLPKPLPRKTLPRTEPNNQYLSDSQIQMCAMEPVIGRRHGRPNSMVLENPEEVKKPSEEKKKPRNLEEALNELEEIYKSLHLGDEDLLDRAERRDIPTPRPRTPRLIKEEDLTSSEDLRFEVSRSPRLGPRRRGVPDLVTDDMAYRKLRMNDRSPSCTSPKDVALSQMSYLLMSPDLSIPPSPIPPELRNPNEPDIELDDVVYRNLKYVNSTLKVPDPQPLFGIPLGPVTGTTGSDYLHAKPTLIHRSRFIPRKIPDTVSDDLAFRSLRKDYTKDPLLAEDFRNNNIVVKKRAVRSLSANLFDNHHLKSQRPSVLLSDSELHRLRVNGSTTVTDTDTDVAPSPDLDQMLIDLARETQEKSKRLEIQLQDLDRVTEHAKLCEKLLECVVGSTDLIAKGGSQVEESPEPRIECVVESSAVITPISNQPEMIQLTNDESSSSSTEDVTDGATSQFGALKSFGAHNQIDGGHAQVARNAPGLEECSRVVVTPKLVALACAYTLACTLILQQAVAVAVHLLCVVVLITFIIVLVAP